MKLKFLVALILASMFFTTGPALADACSNRARALVASTPGAMLLAVKSATNANGQTVCVARIKLPARNGNPARVVTRRFRP
ncbi:MAG: hypothetical protein AAF423_04755 [Pseudomonadota bacterium]